MKKIISVMLAIVMLLTSSLGGAEGVLQLPASLIEIGSEAFSGDSSLTVADVPYGTESISSRAFADSELTKIYIPRTVTFIAEDAFAGTDVLISSPDFSYAQTYAEQHGFEWEDCGDHYPVNVMDAAKDILDSGFQLDETELAAPELLPTEGETDPERLKLIEEHNALVLEERELIAAINDTSALDSVAEELSGLDEAFSIEETGSSVEISFSSGQFMIDSDLYGRLREGVSLTDAELSEDGTHLKLTADNKQYYLYISGDNMFLTAEGVMAARSAALLSRSIHPFADRVFEELEKYIAIVDNSMSGLEYYVKLNLEHLEECIKRAQSRHELKWMLGFLPEGVYDDQFAKVLDRLEDFRGMAGAVALFSIKTQLEYGRLLGKKWEEIKAIDDHNHPTENDISPKAVEVSEKLKKEIVSLRSLYVIDAIDTVVGLATSIATVASAATTISKKMPPWLKSLCARLTAGTAATAGLSFLAGLGLNAVENVKESAMKKLDASLHTTVSGKVYDTVTKLPLEYVSVVCGGQNVWTDSTGAYTIYLQPGLNTITFKRDDFQDRDITVYLNGGDELQRDIEMNPAGGTVTGVIRDSEFNEPLANVTILCGDRMELSSYDGSYSISLPVGPQTITYLLDGYIEKTVTLTVEENTRYVRDVWLKNKPPEPTPVPTPLPTTKPDIPVTPASFFKYQLIDDVEIEITKYIGNAKDVVIPSIIEGYPVTRIYHQAFSGCTSLTSVTIPDSVTTIDTMTFLDCTSLTSVTIGNGVTTIENSTFYDCTSLTNVTIGNSVTTIDSCAFWNCSSLTSVTIPDSVTEIGGNAFWNCSSLTNVTIGNSVTIIGNQAFYGCTSLTSVTIPDSVTEIDDEAFMGCTSLTSVTIGNSVTTLGHNAFRDCSSLTSVTIPDSVTSIGNAAFSGCTGLTSVTIPDSVTEIGGAAFWNCSSLTSVTIPDSVTEIGDHAFFGCTSLTSVTIPSSVTKVGNYAFYGCSSLTSVTIPDSVTEIGRAAFEGCNSLVSVTIGNGVTELTSWAFQGNTRLTNVIIGNGVTEIPDFTFEGCVNLTSVTIGNSVTTIGDHAFSGCSSLTSLTIPNGVTEIGNSAFSGCTGLTSLTIPNGVTTIGQYAFFYCTGLTSLTIGSRVTMIGNHAFYCCTSLKGVTIPDSVTEIGDYAFSGCSSLTSVQIRNGVTTIGASAFSDCSSLKGVTIPDSVTTIGASAFSSCSSLTGVQIRNGVTTIGASAFEGCSSLKGVTIPDSVTEIGDYAFNGCSSLTGVQIGNSVTTIGKQAFSYCTSLISVTIGRMVSAIGAYAFYDCANLATVYVSSQYAADYFTNWDVQVIWK